MSANNYQSNSKDWALDNNDYYDEGGQTERDNLLNPQQPKSEDEDDKPAAPIDYNFLYGLKGFAAICVYLSDFVNHFYNFNQPPFEENLKAKYHQAPFWLRATFNSQFHVFFNSNFWIFIFFIVSGFVVPLQFFQDRQVQSVTGAVFRRYFRLMLPTAAVMLLYFIIMKTGASSNPDQFPGVKTKGFHDWLLDSLYGPFNGQVDYFKDMACIGIELIGSYFVLILGQTAVQYRGRFWIYFLTLTWIYIGRITDDLKITDYYFDDAKPNDHYETLIKWYLPVFGYGLIYLDLDNPVKGPRAFDYIRELNFWCKILINVPLFLIFLFYGSITPETDNLSRLEEDQSFTEDMTWDYLISNTVGLTIAANALFFLVLTAPSLMWFFDTWPFSFLGKISFMIFLLHNLVIEWMQDSYVGSKIDPEDSSSYSNGVLNAFFIFTPVLILLATLFYYLVDAPLQELIHIINDASAYLPNSKRLGKLEAEKNEKRDA